MKADTAAVDNDVLLKLACYGLLDELPAAAKVAPESVHVLGAARFVVGNLIRKSSRIDNREDAKNNFERFLARVIEVEPTESEVQLSTRIEELAIECGADFDTGESQLCAVTISRALSLLVTGDKRAIESLEVLLGKMIELAYLHGRLMCLEQLFLAILADLDHESICESVCAESKIDKAIAICCGCSLPSQSKESMMEGLRSYVQALRQTAPRPLCSRS